MHAPSSPRSLTADVRPSRLDYLDAARAFALVLGVVFHASMSFMPVFVGWAVQDISTSSWVSTFVLISHSFRMEAFFLLAGYFSCVVYQRKGFGGFVRVRAVRLGVPFVVGWFVLRPLLVSGWLMGSASLRGNFDFWAGIRGGFESLKTFPAGIFTGSHLWFLYYLGLVTALVLLLRGVVVIAGRAFPKVIAMGTQMIAWLARSPFSLPVLVAPTAVALWFMRNWGMDTPDLSLWPDVPVLSVYSLFFGVGWMFARQSDWISLFSRLSIDRWILAGVGITATLWLAPVQADPGNPRYTLAHIAFSVGYALMMWSLVALTFGVFKKLCRAPSPSVRYLADSSYWMYLVHLPVVVWLQVAVAEVPVHWSIKLGFVSAVTIGGALLTYDLFVRSTFIGQILNGRRRERALRLGDFSRRRDGDEAIPQIRPVDS